MTEHEWSSSSNPSAMLEHLRRHNAPSDRRLRLFAVGCCRQVWDRLTDERSRRAVEVAERFADGEATEEELRAAHAQGWDFGRYSDSQLGWQPVIGNAAGWCAQPRHELSVANNVSQWLLADSPPLLPGATQAALLREVFGNPWRRDHAHVSYHHEWQRSPTVLSVARAIYDGRRWEDCPVLADALEEAGCENEDILFHLRGEVGCDRCQGAGIYYDPPYSLNRLKCPHCTDGLVSPPPHCRGCWVVDLILGKG